MFTMNDVSHIRLHWSESNHINRKYRNPNGDSDIERDIGLDDLYYEISVASTFVKGGYDKTKMTIVFNDGSQYQFRMDVNERENNLKSEVQDRIKIFNEKIERGEV